MQSPKGPDGPFSSGWSDKPRQQKRIWECQVATQSLRHPKRIKGGTHEYVQWAVSVGLKAGPRTVQEFSRDHADLMAHGLGTVEGPHRSHWCTFMESVLQSAIVLHSSCSGRLSPESSFRVLAEAMVLNKFCHWGMIGFQ